MGADAATTSVTTIDCEYIQAGRAAAYLLVDGKQAAFVDTNTGRAVPLLLDALRNQGLGPRHVAWIIVTHVHLDHCAGAAPLAERCPNATVLVHPRGAPHLVEPERLVAGAKTVYGQALYDALYGTIEPVDAARVRSVEDGESVRLGERTLRFLHTRGHANHHICVYDQVSNAVFTGDAFGTSPPRTGADTGRFVLFSCPPTSFHAQLARASVRRIVGTGARDAYLAHFGEISRLGAAAAQLERFIDAFEALLKDATASGTHGAELLAFCKEGVRNAVASESETGPVQLTAQGWDWLASDIHMNAQGLAYLVEKDRRASG